LYYQAFEKELPKDKYSNAEISKLIDDAREILLKEELSLEEIDDDQIESYLH
jgi:hypothetical protein